MIESLAADKDFKMPLNRTVFEQWTAHLLARVTKPIDDALADAKLTLVRSWTLDRGVAGAFCTRTRSSLSVFLLSERGCLFVFAFYAVDPVACGCRDGVRWPTFRGLSTCCPAPVQADIHFVEIIGGGIRVPRIQSILTDYFAPLPLGTHLNGDEAPVMGAAFIAANRSSAFRVKPVGALDTTPFAVTVNLTSLHPEVRVGGQTAYSPHTRRVLRRSDARGRGV